MSDQSQAPRRRGRTKSKDVVGMGRAGLIDTAKVIFAMEDHAKLNRRIFTARASVDPSDRLMFRIKRMLKIFRDQSNHHEMVRTSLYDRPNKNDHRDKSVLLRYAVSDLKNIVTAGAECGQKRDSIYSARLHPLNSLLHASFEGRINWSSQSCSSLERLGQDSADILNVPAGYHRRGALPVTARCLGNALRLLLRLENTICVLES